MILLLDKKFEKLDEKHVYCHYCDMAKLITLHWPNDGDRLLIHISTTLHINNKAKVDKRAYIKSRTTFLFQYITSIDNHDNNSQHNDSNNLQYKDNINSQYKGNNNLLSNFLKSCTSDTNIF